MQGPPSLSLTQPAGHESLPPSVSSGTQEPLAGTFPGGHGVDGGRVVAVHSQPPLTRRPAGAVPVTETVLFAPMAISVAGQLTEPLPAVTKEHPVAGAVPPGAGVGA